MSTSTNIDSSGVALPVLGLPSEIYEMVQPYVGPQWLEQINLEGALVRLFREYVEGRQRSFLTSKQRAALNIKTEATEQLYMNYCDMVIQTMVDRLTVTAVEGDTPEASQWGAQVLAFNRMDGLQMDATEASLRDGVGYMMVAYDNAAQMPVFAHEPAWDGSLGMIAVYDRLLKNIVVAIKVWYENSLNRRFNVYWPDRVEKFVETSDGGQRQLRNVVEEDGKPLTQFDDQRFGAAWVDRNGKPLGVPVIAFPNRAKSHRTSGISELAPVIPLQDALNRTLIDTIITSGLTAFQIKFALGFKPPETIAPGDTVYVEGPVGTDQQVDYKALTQGQITPFIEQMSFYIDQIGTISRTPLPDVMGSDSSSGEALKQREAGLIAKTDRFKVKAGNDWEDLMAYAARLQAAFGTSKPPAAKRWNTQWKASQVRNDSEVIANALAVADHVGEAEFLRMIAPVYGWDETKIKALLAEKAQQQQAALANLGGNLPGFSEFTVPLTTGQTVAGT